MPGTVVGLREMEGNRLGWGGGHLRQPFPLMFTEQQQKLRGKQRSRRKAEIRGLGAAETGEMELPRLLLAPRLIPRGRLHFLSLNCRDSLMFFP